MRSTDRADDKHRAPAARTLLRDTRGGVHTEGAMVAVLLATLFGGFLWIHARTRVEIDTVRSAGRELWRPALEGCEHGTPAPARAWIGGYRGVQRDIAPEAAERLDDVRVADTIAQEVRQARRPELLGGGLVEIRSRSGTACNPRMLEGEIAWQQRVVELFCERYPLEPTWAAGCYLDRPPSGE